MQKIRSLFCVTVLCFVVILTAKAQEADPGKAEAAAQEKVPPPKEQISESQHQVEIHGETIRYTARAGTLVLKDEQGKAKASIFFVSYSKDEVPDPARRPITFAFNGGPGSSSVWLHLGAVGPRRVPMDPEGFELPPPYRLVNNEYSLLDLTDLVFIDPVTTGYSRSAPGEDPQQFHGVTEDVESVGEFIRLFTTRYARWASPKFLIGESYGTTRAAGLAGFLQGRLGMYLNGIILVSSVLNFQTLEFDVGNDMPYPLFLPSYSATAWFHKKLSPEFQDLRQLLSEVETFAATDYTLALMQGSSLSEEERLRLAGILSRYTGLSLDYVLKSDLRILDHRFFKELRRSDGLTVGRLDSRFTGFDRDSAGEQIEFDPSMAAIRGPYTATLNDYVRRDLGFESDLPYEILSGRVRPWKYGPAQNRYLNVAETLRQAMTQNRNLKVLVASGYYDLATPYFATDYTLDHLSLDQELRKNISVAYYEAGHMMYIREASLAKLKLDISAFMASTLSGSQ